jgi:hypothetical protein
VTEFRAVINGRVGSVDPTGRLVTYGIHAYIHTYAAHRHGYLDHLHLQRYIIMRKKGYQLKTRLGYLYTTVSSKSKEPKSGRRKYR